MAKDTFYFTHDYNARTDEKIKSLLRKHGMIGYGVYWSIIEDLYNNANALRTDYEGIAFDLRTTELVVKSVICDFDLFCIDGDYFGSLSVERRLNERNDKSQKARKSALQRWNTGQQDANAMRTHSDSNAIKERKGKEKKESKEDNTPPTAKVDVYPFDQFWDDYGKKVDSKKCRSKWAKIINKDKLLIKDYLPKYVNATPDVQYRKNPLTFLNGETWNDDLPKGALKPPKYNSSYERWDGSKRWFGSTEIPYDAPPRPDNLAKWDKEQNKWIHSNF